MSCPNVFSFKFNWYSYFATFIPRWSLESHLNNEVFNNCFVIAAWLDLLYKLIFSVVQCMHHGLTYFFTIMHKGRHSLFSLPLEPRGIYSPEATRILLTLEGYSHKDSFWGHLCSPFLLTCQSNVDITLSLSAPESRSILTRESQIGDILGG